MSRAVLILLLAAALLLPTAGSAQVAPSFHNPVITLAGRLSYETESFLPHYRLAGFVLLYPDSQRLADLVGQEVVVVGTEVGNPTIYMHRALEVHDIKTPSRSGTPDQVILPVVHEEPIPLFGTPHYLLFGKVELRDARYYVVGENETGETRVPVSGRLSELESLVGQPAGVVVSRTTAADGTVHFLAESAIPLTGDLGERIRQGRGLIYSQPARQITVRLGDRVVDMDQPPVLGNSRTLIGLRAVSEGMGAHVTWESATRTAAITLGDRTVLVRPGSNLILVRQQGAANRVILADTTPVLVNGRMMVPVRALSEILGLKVHWDAATWTVELHPA